MDVRVWWQEHTLIRLQRDAKVPSAPCSKRSQARVWINNNEIRYRVGAALASETAGSIVRDMARMVDNPELADVLFVFPEEKGAGERVAQGSAVVVPDEHKGHAVVYAHRIIINHRCPGSARLITIWLGWDVVVAVSLTRPPSS